MFKYVVRRVFQMIPVFIGVTLILFILRAPGVLPGDPVRMITGERGMTDALRQQIIEKHGLDQPLYRQYVIYLGNLLQGDLGESYQRGRAVTEIFADKLPNTLRLALAAIVIEAIVGVTAGIISAVRQYSFLDVLVTLSTSILVSVPVFWLGMLFQIFFGIKLKEWTGGAFYLPISQMSSGEFPDWAHMILPAITLASVSTAYVARIMRSQMLEAMGQDYIRTAEAKGLTRRAVTFRHALKNALIPVVTFVGIDFGVMMGGAILTETVFSWPGVGREIFLAVGQRDWPIVMGGVVIIVFLVMIINLLVDLSYALLDPRIRYGGGPE
ncbi:MAG: ABC transporter permease [Anaerosomatales bacterium]|nr:ABC transporter permease [Anaerosomatales bacterium]MDT8434534.1 ABC transporter permease [Anaerosomatales bacterium]